MLLYRTSIADKITRYFLVLTTAGMGSLFSVSASLVNVSPRSDSSSTCGAEDPTIQPHNYAWGVITTADLANYTIPISSQVKTISIGTALTKNDYTLSIIEPYLSNDSNALAYLLADNIPVNYNNIQMVPLISLNIVTKTGRHLSLASSPNWVQLGPELSPGHFGILALGPDGFAQILSADWTGNQIVVTLVKQLPFQIGIRAYGFQRNVFVSPNWSLMGYTTEAGDFEIYSVTNNKVLWVSPNIGDQLPQLIWGISSNIVAIVNMGLYDGNGKLIEVDSHGNAQILADLGLLFGSATRLIDFTTINASGKMVLMADNNNTQFLVIVDANNGRASRLCVPSRTVMNSYLNLNWIGNSDLFTLQTPPNDYTGTPLKMIIYSVQTGTYSFAYPAADSKPAWVLAWSDD